MLMWKVKGKKAISFFRSLGLQSYCQISAKHLDWLVFGFFFPDGIINLFLRSESSEQLKDQPTNTAAINNNLN